jgi:hypothetical protein
MRGQGGGGGAARHHYLDNCDSNGHLANARPNGHSNAPVANDHSNGHLANVQPKGHSNDPLPNDNSNGHLADGVIGHLAEMVIQMPICQMTIQMVIGHLAYNHWRGEGGPMII